MSGGLWRRLTQTELIIAKLREARAEDRSASLQEIMRLGIAQHGARLKELRLRGFVIENELERDGEAVRSCYWLRHDPERDGGQQ